MTRRGLYGWGAAVSILALALRLLALEQALPAVPLGDENYYAGVADNLAAGRGHVSPDRTAARAAWPPAQAYLLSLFIDPSLGDSHKDPRRVEPLLRLTVVLGTVLVVLVIGLGAVLFDRRTAIAAGSVAAVYPSLIAYSHYLWSETLFAVLFTAGLIGVVSGRPDPSRLDARQRIWIAASSGLLFGCAALTREIALPLALVCAGWWIWIAPSDSRGRAAVPALVLVVITGAVVLPWTARNQALFGRVVPVSTVGWMGLREGNLPGPLYWAGDLEGERERDMRLEVYRRERARIADEMERADTDRREALASIREAQPGWLPRKLASNLPGLYSPDSFLFNKIRRGRYPRWDASAIRAVLASTVTAYVLVVTAGVLGIAAAGGAPGSRARGRSALPILCFGVLTVVHVAAQAKSRYRVPFMPLLIVYASYAAVHWRSLGARLSRPRALAAGLVLLVFVGLCIPGFAATGIHLWQSDGPILRAVGGARR